MRTSKPFEIRPEELLEEESDDDNANQQRCACAEVDSPARQVAPALQKAEFRPPGRPRAFIQRRPPLPQVPRAIDDTGQATGHDPEQAGYPRKQEHRRNRDLDRVLDEWDAFVWRQLTLLTFFT